MEIREEEIWVVLLSLVTEKYVRKERMIKSILRQPCSVIKVCQFRNSRGGGWSKDGCELASHRNDTVTCECNHLTNFAVLMDPSGISSMS